MDILKLIRLSWLIITALIVAGCGSQTIQLEESSLLRYFEKKSGLIAYQAMDGNLYTINQAGEEKTQITNDVEGMPMDIVFGLRSFAWSPDSEQLAYVGFTEQQWTIEVNDVKGKSPTQHFADNTSQPIYLNWNPEGDLLTFLTASDPAANNGSLDMQLRTKLTASTVEASILAEGFPLYYSWEPGGNRAVTHIGGSRENNEEARISMFTLGSTFERDFGLPPAQFFAPAWSPVGTEILMAIKNVQGQNALVISSLQGQIRQTVKQFDTAITFTWSPDGDYVGYIESERTRQGASGHLTIYDSISREDVFTTEEGLVHAFFWSPDSEEVLFFTQELIEEEGRGELVAGLRIHILNIKNNQVRHIQLGPDAYVFQPTPQFLRYLLAFDQFQQGATIWSPDGEYIVLPAIADGQGVILALATSGGIQPRLLTDGVMALWSWK